MEQCQDFGISYYEEGKIFLPADVILRSKATGYDKAHQDFLQPLRNEIVQLSKAFSDAPGWYTVELS